MGMELRQLEAFVAAAEEGGITRAAGRLHVVQSAVSASLRRLEAELGMPLFERRARGVDADRRRPRAAPPRARRAAAAEAGREAVDAVRGGLRGTVRLGIMQSHRRRARGSASRGSCARSTTAIRASSCGSGTGRLGGDGAQVAEGTLDLAFVALPDAPPGVELTPLASEPIDLICPPGIGWRRARRSRWPS